MRFAKRVDGNHKEIRDALRKVGYKVRDYSKCGMGVPDLCVMVLPGYPLFLEIKDPKQNNFHQQLSEAEKEWMEYCGSITRKILSFEEAIKVIQEYQRELRCMMSKRAE